MNIAELIQLKFPEANFSKDIVLQDDGEGPYIKEWNLEVQEPTQKDLDSWVVELEQAYQDKIACEKRLLEYPPIEALVVAMWKNEVLNDNAELLELQAKREEIQAKYPKSDD